MFDVFHCEKIMKKELHGLFVSSDVITCLSEVTNLMAFIDSFNVNEELTGDSLASNLFVQYKSFLL